VPAGGDEERRTDTPRDAVLRAGEKKKLCVMSPRPLCEPDLPATSLCSMSGTIVREITFQSSSSVIGMTGWMLSRNCWPSAGPTLPS
jgi:hypothetical protein